MNQHEERYFCRVCQGEEDTGQALKLAQEYAASLPAEQCVPEKQYSLRLQQCGFCSSLAGGSTCIHCGCFVVARARKKQMDCPHPAGSRWT